MIQSIPRADGGQGRYAGTASCLDFRPGAGNFVIRITMGPMTTAQWARLRAKEAGHIRQGAWYRVVKLTASEVVLDVHGKPTPFPRQSVSVCRGGAARALPTIADDLGRALRRLSELP